MSHLYLQINSTRKVNLATRISVACTIFIVCFTIMKISDARYAARILQWHAQSSNGPLINNVGALTVTGFVNLKNKRAIMRADLHTIVRFDDVYMRVCVCMYASVQAAQFRNIRAADMLIALPSVAKSSLLRKRMKYLWRLISAPDFIGTLGRKLNLYRRQRAACIVNFHRIKRLNDAFYLRIVIVASMNESFTRFLQCTATSYSNAENWNLLNFVGEKKRGKKKSYDNKSRLEASSHIA